MSEGKRGEGREVRERGVREKEVNNGEREGVKEREGVQPLPV